MAQKPDDWLLMRLEKLETDRSNDHTGKPPAPLDPAVKRTLRRAKLRYSSDSQSGITREGRGKTFRYRNARGTLVRDAKTLKRIRSLVIPPAWKDVWICTRPDGHLQATGRDARGRKQYRYHPRWREIRDDLKYGRLVAFAKALPTIRKKVSVAIRRPKLDREKVLATVVKLLETTLIRVGNDEYARSNDSFGLTTMQDRHARITGGKVQFKFKGKSGVKHSIDLDDKRLARIVKQCQELPGQELFQYRDDNGRVRDIGSGDVNAYLQEISGTDFTAKDFRTWAGTVLAAQALREFQEFDSAAAAKRNILRAIEQVAERLGNTKAVCRKCYIHPAIFDAYLDRSLIKTLEKKAERELRERLPRVSPEEAAVLAFLRQRLARELSAKP